MIWLIKQLKRLAGDERGAVALAVAGSLTALVGLTGAAVDLGALYSAKADIQNAADAAALAAAAEMLTYNAEFQAVAQPDLALAAAHTYSSAHYRVEVQRDPGNPLAPPQAVELPLTLLDQDFTIGVYDLASHSFQATGFSSDPNDLTGVEVKLRRDDLANDTVKTYFAKLLGFDNIPLTTTSRAFLGWAGSNEGEGAPVLPITVKSDAVNGGLGLEDHFPLTFYSEGDETAEWTTFFTWPSNDVTVKRYINGTLPIPTVKVGDTLNVTNGNLSTNTWNALMGRFAAEGEDRDGNGERDYWLVALPVVTPGCPPGGGGAGAGGSGGDTSGGCHEPCEGEVRVVGFLHYVITYIQGAPGKYVEGYVTTNRVFPGSATGGGNYGTRASRPVMVN